VFAGLGVLFPHWAKWTKEKKKFNNNELKMLFINSFTAFADWLDKKLPTHDEQVIICSRTAPKRKVIAFFLYCMLITRAPLHHLFDQQDM